MEGASGGASNPVKISEETISKADGKTSKSAIEFKCIHSELDGKVYPSTGVPFTKKTIKKDGLYYEVCGPDFPSKAEIKLPDSLRFSSDSKQFTECNRQLYEMIQGNEKLYNQFTDRQIQQLKNGDTPQGLTWDHTFEIGKMRLVNSWLHARTPHTGGKSFWGGGKDYR